MTTLAKPIATDVALALDRAVEAHKGVLEAVESARQEPEPLAAYGLLEAATRAYAEAVNDLAITVVATRHRIDYGVLLDAQPEGS